MEQDAFASGNRSRIVGGPLKVILERKPSRRSTKLHRNESKISNSYEDIRGFEIELSKMKGKWVTGFLNYEYR